MRFPAIALGDLWRVFVGQRLLSRNGLSHANRERPAEMAEALFWRVMAHLGRAIAGLWMAGRRRGAAFRFKLPIHVVDSTTIQLVAYCMDWAKHRRRKAAAKCHLRLDLHSHLPRFALIDTARDNDAKRAREVCAGLREGEIVLFDKAYVDFGHLWDPLSAASCGSLAPKTMHV